MNSCINLYNSIISKQYKHTLFLKKIYNILEKGDDILKQTSIHLKKIGSNKKQKDNIKSNYIPEQISKFISNTNCTSYEISVIVNGIKINLYFYCYEKISDKTLMFYSYYVFLTIFLLTFNIKVCNKIIDIKIFLTNFKKYKPNDYNKILGVNEVNTGYSTVGCQSKSEIVIYRKEEWFKVLIHELFHNLNLDFANLNIFESKQELYKLLGLDIKYEITETYCEIWARIINMNIAAFIKTDNFTGFKKIYEDLLKKEIFFSLLQASKILKFVRNNNKYTEDSNVYAYYVLTSAIFMNYNSFIEWCQNNNNNFFKFNNENIKQFTKLIIESLKNKKFQKLQDCLSYIETNNSLRMSFSNIL